MSRTNRCDPVAADASLHLVADELVAGLRSGLEPSLVHVIVDGPHAQLGLKPLDGHHPSELLVGFTAPSSWHALGVATRGHAYPIAERGAASQSRPRARVDVVALLSRSGELAHRVHVRGDDDLAAALGAAPDETTGEQIDLLRLALGLPTDPPPCRSDVFWTVEWLSGLLGAAPEEVVTWDDVIARHPAMALLTRTGDAGDASRSDDFVDVVTAFCNVCTWGRLRSLVGDGRFTAPELVPSDAAWFDDGGFARFLLSPCPPLSMLRAQADGQLPDGLARRLHGTLDELGVPAAPWPDTAGGEAA